MVNISDVVRRKGFSTVPISGMGSDGAFEGGFRSRNPVKYEYDAWGVPLETNQATAQQFRLTQKERDPDAIGANVQNARVHFPLRCYFEGYGLFGQIDPLLMMVPPVPMRHPYLYAGANPSLHVDPWGDQEPGEIAETVSRIGVARAAYAYKLSRAANRIARETGLPGPGNGLQDAFRHCLWLCLMTRHFANAEVAAIVGEAHEKWGLQGRHL